MCSISHRVGVIAARRGGHVTCRRSPARRLCANSERLSRSGAWQRRQRRRPKRWRQRCRPAYAYLARPRACGIVNCLPPSASAGAHLHRPPSELSVRPHMWLLCLSLPPDQHVMAEAIDLDMSPSPGHGLWRTNVPVSSVATESAFSPRTSASAFHAAQQFRRCVSQNKGLSCRGGRRYLDTGLSPKRATTHACDGWHTSLTRTNRLPRGPSPRLARFTKPDIRDVLSPLVALSCPSYDA